MLAVHIPEEDRCLDVLELIEYEKLLIFHAQTLTLYGALCFQSNTRAAHVISFHVDEKQLMYAIKSEYMSGPLRTGFADLLIALHLQSFAQSRSLTQNEFIVPCGQDLTAAYSENENLHNSMTTLECFSIRPEMKQSDKVEKVETVKDLSSPTFEIDLLKQFTMEALDDAVKKLNRPMRDPIGGSNENLFVPLIKMADKLLLIGCIDDADLNWLLLLIDPQTFDANYDAEKEGTLKGLLQMTLDEGVKLEMCYLLHHLFDLQLRHRVESIVSFCEPYIENVQGDQLKRYLSAKQEELPAAVAAKRTREFRCAPSQQMRIILGFKNTEDGFHDGIMSKVKSISGEEEATSDDGASDSGYSSDGSDKKSWSSKLMGLIKRVKSAASESQAIGGGDKETTPEDTYHTKVIETISCWAQESEIENRELVRQMFSLLLRCYNGVGELVEALEQTYVLSSSSKQDVITMFEHLTVVRSLLPVQMSPEEEEIMRETLWTLAMNSVFFQHPDLIRILKIHENVMDIMTMTLSKRAQTSGSSAAPTGQGESGPAQAVGDTSAMVVACCKFLCYFCRSSRQNQKAMFEHLDFLLENSNILLSRPSIRGSTPLAVAESSVMENPELALALRENKMEKIAVYLSKCGFQSNQDLLDKGYPDIGWDPVEGSQYLGFFKTCVWVNGESVEENANLVIRLLIRRPECLGPALRGEGEGLLQAIKDAIGMSDRIVSDRAGQPDPRLLDEDYIDMGAAILSFYCTLVDVLGRCAPEAATIAQGKNDCMRARAILRSLVPMADLEGVLSLCFDIKTPDQVTPGGKGDLPRSFIPLHKQAMVRFLERVYGVENQETFFRLLEEAFLPDLRAATVLERHDGTESEMALALNRYIGNFVLPLLIKYSHYFGNAENWSSLMDATLHTCYRMSKVKILTKGQRECVSDFLVALTHEMNPGMLLGLLRKLTVDVSVLTEYSTVALRLLTLHYDRCGKYYGHGGQNTYGTASEEERKLTMLLFSNIFDSLAKMEYDPDLFGKALPCLTAIACALPPDYSLTTSAEDAANALVAPADGPYKPNPVPISGVSLTADLHNIVQKFSEHYHDAWSQRKFENGWTYKETWSMTRKTHPRLKPYHMLTETERNKYREPIADALKTLIASNWKLDQTDNSQAAPRQTKPTSGSVADYQPQPVDMSSLSLGKDLLQMAEKLSENAHEMWASFTINTAGGPLHPQMVPYDLLTDKEKRKNRERSQELLKYLQYEGYKVYKDETNILNRSGSRTGQEADHSGTPGGHQATRFASSLLEKLNNYLDTASISLKLLKPSTNFSRRNSFKQTTRDIKFFSKVVLQLVEKLFVAHRAFFLTSATVTAGGPQAGVATPKEKEMVAALFCKLAHLLRSKLTVMVPDAKISVRCLQTLIQATDARTIVRNSPDFVKTSMLTFFNHAAEDLANCVVNLQSQKFATIRGTHMKTSTSLNYIQRHQVACYKILNSLYTLGTNTTLHCNRSFIKKELDHHRPAMGNCLGAFAATFPVAFLEPALNKNNKNCIHSRAEEFSIEAQAVMQDLEASMPSLDDLLAQLDKYVEAEQKYAKEPHVVDILLPMLCAYLPFWWSQGPDNGSAANVTAVSTDHLNKMLKTVFNLLKTSVSQPNNQWLVTLAGHAGMVIINSAEELLQDPVLPLAEKIRLTSERVFHKEEVTRSFLKSGSEETSDLESQLQDEYAMLVRDIYAFYPLLIKYVDLQRSHWLKNNVPEAEKVYHCVASIFNVWSKSAYMRKEEQNFISGNEIDNMALIMPTAGKPGRPVVTKTETASPASGGKVKKKKRDGNRNKEKELASSLMVSALKRLLPVGLNLFAGREQELVQYAKDKFLKKENESAIFEYVRTTLNLPDKIDLSDPMSWQHYLYSKLGKKEEITGEDGTVATVSNTPAQPVKQEDKEKLQELLVARIIDMAKVLYGLHVIDHPSLKDKAIYKSVVTTSRKRAVIACFRMVSLHSLPRHRAMNIFLKIYNETWLTDENLGQEQLVENLTQSFEDSEQNKGVEEEGEAKPDPLAQLVTTLSRKAMTDDLVDDKLFMEYAYIFSQSCGGAEEDEGGDGDEEGEEPSIAEQELEKQRTLFHQARLVERGVAEMVLLYISACKGIQTPMVLGTLKLGISILRGGNIACQQRMIQHLKDKKDAGFFTSVAGLMNSLTVLDLDAFERNQKAEGLGVGSEGTAGEKNMHDEEFSCALFRFIQLLCEGHNLDFQNYLRTQAGNTTTVNVIIITVDYLLRLQESMMDFYWHYSSKDVIDPSGKENYCKAINVAKQVFSTLTESIQGPCQGNQQALAHSRLWDAVGGFLFLFAHMQDKLSKNSSQLDLLIELLDLQKEMVVMMLSMLEGNVVNGTIGRQMVDTLVESAANVEMLLRYFNIFLKLNKKFRDGSFKLILKFFDMFLKLPELTSSAAFQEIDKKSIGWVTAKDFRKAMEQQKVYAPDEIDYLMSCVEPTHDGLVDYREFTERFSEPAKEIGFNLAVLLTNLSEHMPSDPRLQRFLEIASSILGFFEPFLGRIEIMGSAKRVERVYFEIKESSIDQWEKPQIKESKRAFFYFIVTEGGDKEKLEYFVDFCEDAIFEMQHAANIAMEEEEETPKSVEFPFLGEEEKPPSIFDPVYKVLKYIWDRLKKFLVMFAPANIKKQIQIMKTMTPVELALGFVRIIMRFFLFSGSTVFKLTRSVLKFILRLMTGEPITGPEDEEEDEEVQKQLALVNPFTLPESALPAPLPAPLAIEAAAPPPAQEVQEEVKPLIAAPGEPGDQPPGSAEKTLEPGTAAESGDASAASTPGDESAGKELAIVATAPEQPKEESKKEEEEAQSMPEVVEEVKPEQAPLLSSINFGMLIHRFVCFLARNFYNLKYVALFIAFMINFILLFYRVSVVDDDDDESGSGSGALPDFLGSGVGSGSGDGSLDSILGGSGDGSGDGEEDEEEVVYIEERLYYLNPLIRSLAIIHAAISFCMLVGYYYLKLPLGIFKREKEIARRMEFDGLYVSEQPADDDIIGHWDKLVISTPSFPVNYWDKFAKKKVRDKYAEQYGYEQISALLGMDKKNNEAPGILSFVTAIDWKYQIWKVGVTVTDNSFLYNLWYFTMSVLGNWNYFFYCAHLLDIAVAIASLRTILQSVTHNGKQLVLTVMLLTIIVYIYTVIAFNFFRKFYVQEGEDEEAEPDRKCHNMLNCFVFMLYQGVRAGGGIGDVIEPPDGDEFEMYRIVFDITFFFFIIVILLAIIQGLIIDAFGELRGQLQSVVDDMEAACFICGIGKDYFDKVPHGFETHVQKEHNLANYLFFLMHLINKPDTDYTGQETYVWEMYQQRCWDFFPVGECFQKQYENELG
ncbi:Ryanodine receptor [Halotydeus destructor]|nr:Ryanodine receptor [Halotydeus destructor]